MPKNKQPHFLGYNLGTGFDRTFQLETSLKEEQIVYAEVVLVGLAKLASRSPKVIVGSSRGEMVVRLRWIFVYFLSGVGFKDVQISAFLHSRKKGIAKDHATIVYMKKKFHRLLESNYYKNIIDNLEICLQKPREVFLDKLASLVTDIVIDNKEFFIPFDKELSKYDRAFASLCGISSGQLEKLEKILAIVSSVSEQKSEDIIGPIKKEEFVEPRRLCMVLFQKELKCSLAVTGKFFIGKNKKDAKDHAAVLHAKNKHTRLLDIGDKKYTTFCELVLNVLSGQEKILAEGIDDSKDIILLTEDYFTGYFFNCDEVERILNFNKAKYMPPSVAQRLRNQFSFDEVKRMCFLTQTKDLILHAGLMSNPDFFIRKIKEGKQAT